MAEQSSNNYVCCLPVCCMYNKIKKNIQTLTMQKSVENKLSVVRPQNIHNIKTFDLSTHIAYFILCVQYFDIFEKYTKLPIIRTNHDNTYKRQLLKTMIMLVVTLLLISIHNVGVAILEFTTCLIVYLNGLSSLY